MFDKIWASATVVAALGGWYGHSLYVDSQTLAAERAAAIAMQHSLNREFESAKVVEDKLQELRANERVIHTREREVVDRPVYRNICLDDDGLFVIKSYATKDASSLSAD